MFTSIGNLIPGYIYKNMLPHEQAILMHKKIRNDFIAILI